MLGFFNRVGRWFCCELLDRHRWSRVATPVGMYRLTMDGPVYCYVHHYHCMDCGKRRER